MMIDYSPKVIQEENKRHLRFDFILFFAVMALSGFGLLIIYSATRFSLPGGVTDPAFFLKRQAYAFAGGIFLFVILLFVDYKKIKRWWILIFVSGAALAFSPLVFGYEVHYTRSWIDLGFTTVQPSEIAKIFMVVSVSAIFSKWKGEKENQVGFKKVALSLAVAVVFTGLVLLQSDFGTSLVFFITYLGLLFISGANLLYFLGILGASTGLVFLGRQTNLNYVPEHQTDFIFSVIGEELGFIGCFVVILVLGVVIWRCFSISYQATDHFGSLIAAGLAFIILTQMLINIGMTIGIMPIIGIPLPFLSYGGSSLLALLMGLALVENVYMRRELRPYRQIAYEEFE